MEAEAALLGSIVGDDGMLAKTERLALMLAAATSLGSPYGVSTFSRALGDAGSGDAERVAGGRLLSFVRRLARGASVSRDDLDALQAAGLSGAHVLEAIHATALARFLCTLSAGLGVAPGGKDEESGPAAAPDDGPWLAAPELESFGPFERLAASYGFVPALYRAQTLRPGVLAAEVLAVERLLLSGDALTREQREFVFLVASAGSRSTYLVALQTASLGVLGIDEETSDRIATDHRRAGLRAADVALLDFAERLAGDADGLDRRQAGQVVATVALARFLDTIQRGLGAVPDFPPRIAWETNPIAGRSRPIEDEDSASLATMPAPDADRELVERARAGDMDAFEELVKRHERRVYRTVLGITGNEADAEDCAQRTFLKAFRHLHGFAGASTFGTWLTRIAINEGLERLGSRRTFEPLDDEATGEPRNLRAWADTPEEIYARTELKAIVERELLKLPVRYRVAVLLRDIQELSTAEAAALLGLGVPTLKTHLLRGRLMLREALTPYFAPRAEVARG